MPVRRTTTALLATLLVAPAAAGAQATDGTIVTVAGTTAGFAGDGGPATQALMNTPRDVAFIAPDSFVIADFGNDRVRRVMPDGTILTVVGSSRGMSGDDGPATDAQLDRPRGVTAFPGGGFLVTDTFNHRIRRVFPDGTIDTVAGSAQGNLGDGGPATAARLSEPSDTATLPDGGFLIADSGNHRLRRVLPDGTITGVATPGLTLSYPRDVSVADDGSYLVADTGNSRIVRIAADGSAATVVAGGNGAGLAGDTDPARAAQLDQPFSVAALPNGGFVFADTGNDRVRRVTPLGAIFTVAGTTRGESGNGGSANQAQLAAPGAITLAPGGGFLVADTDNQEVRRVSDIGAVPAAQAGRSFNVAPASGDVLVAPLGIGVALPLREEDLVPIGSAVDATTGRLRLATASAPGGPLQQAEVYAGPFILQQGTGPAPYTNFRLPPLPCSSPRVASIAAKRRKKKRKLWVSESGGRWRSSTGSTSAAAVGTLWKTTLLCEGTRVTVQEGTVRVRDLIRGRSRLVTAGQSFLVRTTGPNRGI